MRGRFVSQESRGVLTELVALRGRYCARLLAGSRTIFHSTLFPWDTLNSFPSRSTTFDTFAKMIHRELGKWRTGSFIELNPLWKWYNDTLIQYSSAIANDLPPLFVKRILSVYVPNFFLKICTKNIILHTCIIYFAAAFYNQDFGRIPWDFYMLTFFIFAFCRLLWNI